MPRAAAEQAIQGAEQSQMLRNRQKSQPRDHCERHTCLEQAVEEKCVKGNENDYPERRHR